MSGKDFEKKIVVTGGHMTPAVAVIRELKKRKFENFLWVGRRRTMKGDQNPSAEFLFVKEQLDIPFVNLITGKVIKPWNISSLLQSILNIFKIPIGFIQSFFILTKYKPDIVISFGGYLAVPVVIVGKILGVPSVTHEQTTVTGTANKIISQFAQKVLVSWEESAKDFPKKKVVITGNPVRKEVIKTETNVFDINKSIPTVYVTGGNQGSHKINKTVFNSLSDLLKNYNVIHQTGKTTLTGDFEKAKEFEKKYRNKTKGKYIVRANIYGAEIGEAFHKADLVISRSGANICLDLLATGNMAILIPIPWSLQNEQVKNAGVLEKLGLGKIVFENEFNSRRLLNILNIAFDKYKSDKGFNDKSLSSIRKNAKTKVKFQASSLIVDEIMKVLNVG